ncbi:MAG: murein biosynthesis integral membrane protein MurJ [Planctomycetota bacterium]|jgi:putative peptidoglycan lipid II flippase
MAPLTAQRPSAHPGAAAPTAPPPNPARRLAGKAAGVGGLTAASRLLGLVRDVLQAALLGSGAVADAFVIAWTLPNLARRLFGEGALTAAFLPVFTAVRERDGEPAALRLATRVLTRLLLGLGAAAGLGATVALVAALAGHGKLALFAGLSAVLLPYMPIVCATALCGATGNALNKFALPALPPILLNLAWIGGLAGACWLAQPEARAFAAAGGIVAGAAAGLWVTSRWLARRGMSLRPDRTPGDAAVGEVGRLLWPTLFGLAVVQLNIIADRLIAELCVPGDGGVAALYYGQRLMELPMGLIAVSIATVAFPELARLGARGERVAFAAALRRALRLVLYLAVPAAAGLAVTRGPVVELLFQRGAFDAAAATRTAGVTLYYAAAVIPATLLPVLSRAHHAWSDTRTPVRIGVLCVGLNLALNLTLVWPLGESGLAAATAICAAVQAWLLARALRGRIDPQFRLLRSAAARIAFGAACTAGAAWAALLWCHDASALVQCTVAIPAGVVTYGVLRPVVSRG